MIAQRRGVGRHRIEIRAIFEAAFGATRNAKLAVHARPAIGGAVMMKGFSSHVDIKACTGIARGCVEQGVRRCAAILVRQLRLGRAHFIALGVEQGVLFDLLCNEGFNFKIG